MKFVKKKFKGFLQKKCRLSKKNIFRDMGSSIFGFCEKFWTNHITFRTSLCFSFFSYRKGALCLFSVLYPLYSKIIIIIMYIRKRHVLISSPYNYSLSHAVMLVPFSWIEQKVMTTENPSLYHVCTWPLPPLSGNQSNPAQNVVWFTVTITNITPLLM